MNKWVKLTRLMLEINYFNTHFKKTPMDIFWLHLQSKPDGLPKSDHNAEDSSVVQMFSSWLFPKSGPALCDPMDCSMLGFHCAYDLKCFVIFVIVFIVIATENELTRSLVVKQNRLSEKKKISSLPTKYYLGVYLQYVISYS